MSSKKDILLVGVGGQGTILASRIIAYAARAENLEVKISEVHGMAQRGGSVVTHLRMGEKIYSPLIQPGQANIILSFERLEAWRWIDYLNKDGTVITNTQAISPLPVISGGKEYPSNILEKINQHTSNLFSVDALEIAKKSGNERTANVAMLGVLANNLEIEKSNWVEALENILPGKVIEPNKKAFVLGYSYMSGENL